MSAPLTLPNEPPFSISGEGRLIKFERGTGGRLFIWGGGRARLLRPREYLMPLKKNAPLGRQKFANYFGAPRK